MSRVAVLSLALVAFGAQPVQAQGRAEIGFGFVANPPSQLLGAGVHVMWPVLGGIGLYVDGKIPGAASRGSDAAFLADLTAAEANQVYGDRFLREEHEWQSFNAALMKTVTPELIVYAGAGHSDRSVYAEFEDPADERGGFGIYWVEDPDRSGAEVNFLAGGLLRMSSRLYGQFGFETAPGGMTVGLRYIFPF